jgi:hypothetical protein
MTTGPWHLAFRALAELDEDIHELVRNKIKQESQK